VANSEEKLHAVLAGLEECQTTLALNGERDTAQLVSVAILALRIKLNRIEDSELKALCDAMVREVETAERQRAAKPPEGERRRPPVSLKLVK
jgi:isopropylmalate/homocitrate/citramalate synthase